MILLAAFANDSDKHHEKNKSKQEQQQQDEVKGLPAQFDYYEESYLKEEASSFEPIEEEKVQKNPYTKADTTTSSISKYNYLFYFIYKYKFENKYGLEQIERMITD